MNERPVTTRKGSWLALRVASFGHAFRGLGWLVVSQPNAQIHLAATLVVAGVGFWLGLSPLEWCAILGVTGLVWTTEALNSGLEALADRVSPEHHPLIGRAKDVGAGAVLIAAMIAVAVGLIIFLPKLCLRFGW